MFKRRFSILSVLLVIFLALSVLALGGCETADPPVDDDDNGAPVPDPDPDPDPEFKTVRVAMLVSPLTMDPVNHRARHTQTVHRQFSNALVWAKPDGELVPDLAEYIERIDEVTYEIKIREDVYFHNGDHMTADDLIFSLERIGTEGGMEGETSPRRGLAGPMKSFERIDDYTVRVILERPNHLLQIRNWMHIDVWPKDYYEEVGVEGFMENPIGVGPYKFVEGDITSQIIFERNENYYGGSAEAQGDVDRIPMVDRAIFTFIPEPTTRVAALLAGDVDIIQAVPTDSIQLLEENPNTEVVTAPGTMIVCLQINTQMPPFDDKRVRQAIGYAINYDLMTEQLLSGYAEPLYGRPFQEPFPGEPGHGQFDDVKGFEYNPEKAQALLEEAGASGFSTVVDTVPQWSEQAQAFAQMLNDVGIEASVRVWDVAVLTQEMLAGTRAMRYGSQGNARKSPQWSIGFVKTGEPQNYSHYSNPVLDELFEKAIPMDDGPERNDIFREIYNIILDEVPVVTILAPETIEGIRSNVKNYYPCTQGRINLHRVDIE